MKRCKDRLYKAACRLGRQLEEYREQSLGEHRARMLNQYGALERDCRLLVERFRLVRRAAAFGWRMAFEAHEATLRRQLDSLGQHLRELPPRRAPQLVRVPRVDTFLAELRQLHEEFEEVEFDPKANRVSAVTESIQLRGVD